MKVPTSQNLEVIVTILRTIYTVVVKKVQRKYTKI